MKTNVSHSVPSCKVCYLRRLRLKCDGTHAQKPDFVFRRNGRVHLNRSGGRQFSRLLAAEVCASAVVMLDTPCSEVVWRVLATHCIRQFPLHSPPGASPCAITFQLDCTTNTATRRDLGELGLISNDTLYLHAVYMFSQSVIRMPVSILFPHILLFIIASSAS